MNMIFCLVVLAPAIMMLIVSPENLLISISNASQNTIAFTLKMIGIYAFWLGFIKLLECSRLADGLRLLLAPAIKKLFYAPTDDAVKYIAMNMSCNIIGVGNAATPMGILATQNIKDNTFNLAMLMTINATSLQLLPTTVLSMLSEFKAVDPTFIMLPSILSTIISTACGIIFVFIFFKRRQQ